MLYDNLNSYLIEIEKQTKSKARRMEMVKIITKVCDIDKAKTLDKNQ